MKNSEPESLNSMSNRALNLIDDVHSLNDTYDLDLPSKFSEVLRLWARPYFGSWTNFHIVNPGPKDRIEYFLLVTASWDRGRDAELLSEQKDNTSLLDISTRATLKQMQPQAVISFIENVSLINLPIKLADTTASLDSMEFGFALTSRHQSISLSWHNEGPKSWKEITHEFDKLKLACEAVAAGSG